MKKIAVLMTLSSLLLFGCDAEETSEATEEIPIEEELVEETENWEEAMGDIDFATDEMDDIPWDDIHLTKGQFDDYLKDLIDNKLETDGDEEIEIAVQSLDFDGKTIEITLVDNEDAEEDLLTEVTRLMYILMTDGFTRQFYLVSDYSDGETHPVIIFYDEAGEMITKNSDFIEIDE